MGIKPGTIGRPIDGAFPDYGGGGLARREKSSDWHDPWPGALRPKQAPSLTSRGYDI